jgi:hypothetical protein
MTGFLVTQKDCRPRDASNLEPSRSDERVAVATAFERAIEDGGLDVECRIVMNCQADVR